MYYVSYDQYREKTEEKKNRNDIGGFLASAAPSALKNKAKQIYATTSTRVGTHPNMNNTKPKTTNIGRGVRENQARLNRFGPSLVSIREMKDVHRRYT